MDKPSKRQEEVLLNIHLKDQAYDGERTRDPWDSWSDRHGEPVPAWGRPATYQRTGRAGGARYRMIERMMDAGLIPFREMRSGRRAAITSGLTAKAAKHLAERFPDLPGIADAIRTATLREASELERQRLIAEIRASERAARIAERAKKRREAMDAVLRDFQLRHDLTGDQLEAMWLRIVQEERTI